MPLSLSAFLIIAPAAWRLAYFLTSEMGPFDVSDKLRSLLGANGEPERAQDEQNFQAKLFGCVLCMSFWTALALVGLWQTDLAGVRLALEIVALWSWASTLHLHLQR